MQLLADLKILYHLAIKPIRGKDHPARMEAFYSGQAELYDAFRRRLLHGRRELFQRIGVPPGGVWVDLGGGTGANLEYLGDRIGSLDRVYLVDLAPSLLELARARACDRGWRHVELVEDDATCFRPPAGETADVVTFSYSLTMIPDWFAAIENALAILKPGGRIGVVDFYVSRKHPLDGSARHNWFTRHYWPIHFGFDHVFLSPDHVPFLHRHFDVLHFGEHRAAIPYLPLVRAPYYQFVGRKPDAG